MFIRLGRLMFVVSDSGLTTRRATTTGGRGGAAVCASPRDGAGRTWIPRHHIQRVEVGSKGARGICRPCA